MILECVKFTIKTRGEGDGLAGNVETNKDLNSIPRTHMMEDKT